MFGSLKFSRRPLMCLNWSCVVRSRLSTSSTECWDGRNDTHRRDKEAKKIKDLAAVYDVVVLTNRDWARVRSDTTVLKAQFQKAVEEAYRILNEEFVNRRSAEAVAQVFAIDGAAVKRVIESFIKS